MTELKSEDEIKKMQRNLDGTKQILKITGRELAMAKDTTSKYQNDYQTTCHEIKELKEKVKGNMSLIQAKEIIWNNIIHTVQNIREFMSIVAEEKTIFRDLEGIIAASKQKIQ